MNERPEFQTFLIGIVAVPALLGLIFVAVYGLQSYEVLTHLFLRSPILLTGSADFSQIGGGFTANIGISIVSMTIALIFGAALGTLMISPRGFVRMPAVLIMNFLRNSPWLVILFAMLYAFPFEFELFGRIIEISPVSKGVIGLAIPVTAYVAEVVRGGVQAIPSGQWESARALGYRRSQIMRHVILPQALPIMMPGLMTVYAALFIGTSLVVVTGTKDVISLAKTVIGSDGDRYAIGIYLYLLLLFFLFTFPIAMASRAVANRIGIRS